jgi:hypothetical protein
VSSSTFVDKYVPSKISVPQADLQDLSGYFARPRVYRQGSISVGTIGNLERLTFTAAEIFGDRLGNPAVFPYGEARLLGVHGVRFTLVFTLQVASTPFHQGLLVSSFQYDPTGSFDRSLILPAVTNLPHVRLDLAENTMSQLKVPFVNTHEFLPLVPRLFMVSWH